jgi:hypothetical protein
VTGVDRRHGRLGRRPAPVAAVGSAVAAPVGSGLSVGSFVFVGVAVLVAGRRVLVGFGVAVSAGKGVFVGVAVNGASPAKLSAVAVGTGWLIANSRLARCAAASSSDSPRDCRRACTPHRWREITHRSLLSSAR